MGAELVSLDDSARAGHITLHIPATAETRNLFDASGSHLQIGVRIINTARGELIVRRRSARPSSAAMSRAQVWTSSAWSRRRINHWWACRRWSRPRTSPRRPLKRRNWWASRRR